MRAVELPEVSCPKCSKSFVPKRKNQKYCSRPCAKAATRHAKRGTRARENEARNRKHYDRAAWLSYDVNRMQPDARYKMLLAILEAASGADAGLRNILFDPKLLGADRYSHIGKLYPDTHYRDALNIAKLVNRFCWEEYGCGSRETILDRGKPANRKFLHEGAVIVPPHIYGESQIVSLPVVAERSAALGDHNTGAPESAAPLERAA